MDSDRGRVKRHDPADDDRTQPVLDSGDSWAPGLHSASVSATDDHAKRSETSVPEAGQLLGRYLVLQSLGQGGMGVVVAAFDPALERKVALKLVRPVTADPAGARRHRKFLQREAQALAALNHPNIVPVYDVGEFPIEGSLPGMYVAMELEEGQTLGRWAEAQRSWRQVIDVFLQAGRGLSAAHAAGIVHGDFKPANVLLRSDGRVVVLDFGLARYRGPNAASRSSAAVPSGSLPLSFSSADATLGEAGFVMGTPAYLAPEQYYGEHSAAADQFAFCVAAYRTLFNSHPFAPESDRDAEPDALVKRIRAGRRAPVPRLGRRHARLARILGRGLAHEADDRWPDMESLLRALAAAQRGIARPVAVLTAVVGVAGVLAWPAVGDDVEPLRCDGDFGVSAVWNEDQRSRLADALSALRRADDGAGRDQTWLDETAAVATRDLDRYAAAWIRERRGLCEAQHLAATADGSTSGARQACLDDALAAMGALVGALIEADAPTWANLGRPTSRLDGPEACVQQSAGLARRHEEDDEVQRARRLLATGWASLQAGQHQAAAGAARMVADVAQSRSSPELAARADELLGDALSDAGDYRGAVRHLSRAAWACSLLSCDRTSLKAMSDIVKILSSDLVDFDAAVRWESRARQAIDERGIADPVVEASLYNAIGLLRLARADYEEAEAAFRHAVSRVASRSDADLRLAGVYNNLGNALEAQGRSDEAMVIASRAIAMRERALGTNHPSLASALSNLAISELAAGDIAGARGHLRRAIAITTDAWGTRHPSLANFYNNLANVHYEQGELAAARDNYRRTLAVLRQSVGDTHPHVGLTLGNLGLVTEDHTEALALHRSALDVLERSVASDHPHVALTLNNIGSALRGLGRYPEARDHYTRALKIREQVLGPEHPLTGTTVDNLGRTARLSGDAELAVMHHQRSLSIWTAAYGPQHRRATIAATGLADALLDVRPIEVARVLRARELAESAVQAVEDADVDPADRAAAQLALARSLVLAPHPQPARARRLALQARNVLRGPNATPTEQSTIAAVLEVTADQGGRQSEPDR